MESNGFSEYKRLYEARFDSLDEAVKELKEQVTDLHTAVVVQQTNQGWAKWLGVTLVSAGVSLGITLVSWLLGRH